MKRLFSEFKWSVRTKRVQRKERRQARGYAAALKTRKRKAIRYSAPELRLEAPENFSLIENPAEVIRFFSRVQSITSSRRNVRLDFRAIEVLGPDAIAFLIARCRGSKARHHMRIRATKPATPALRRVWNESGLTDVFRSSDGDEVPEPRGRILTQSMLKADPNAALTLRQFAANHIELEHGSDWLSVQTVLLECMTNTFNHATGHSRLQSHFSDEPWYAAVYCDEGAASAKFSFLDNGIGILANLAEKPPLAERLKMATRSPARVLKAVLEGDISSATGLSHRGEGLPEIRTIVQEDHELDKLVIITNEVLADVSAGTYLMIGEAFPGTFLYWERSGKWRKKP